MNKVFGEDLFEEKVLPKPLSKTFSDWVNGEVFSIV